MPQCNLNLLVNVGDVRSLIVGAECENTVLIWNSEVYRESHSIDVHGSRNQVEAVVRIKHSKLELQRIIGRELEGDPAIHRVLRESDLKSL